MMLFVKKNKCILAISLDKYIFLSKVVIIDNLQSIRDVCCLPALIRLYFRQWVESIYTFINVLANSHAIKLINTGADKCFSTLDRWTTLEQ